FAFTRKYGIPDEANSWEDWAQRQIAFANRIFAEATYPSTPDGVLDRWRIDQVIVVGDGKLPLAGGFPGNNPDNRDKTVDLVWGYDAPIISTGFYNQNDPNSAFFQEPSLIHEMLHARYLVDTYGLDVTGGQTGLLDEKGVRLFANTNAMVHENSQAPSMMGGCSPVMGEWEAAALNLWARKRPRAGWANYNSNGGLGWYLEHRMPAENSLRVTDAEGKPLAGATIQIFQAGSWPFGGNPLYGKYIDNTADLTGSTDAQGLLALGSNPFSVAEPIGEWDFPRCIDLIRVNYRGHIRYAWLDIAEVQVQHLRGVTDAYYDIIVDVDPDANLAPLVNAGEDRVVFLPDPVPLAGTVTDDGRPVDPGRVAVTWSKVSGPGTVTFGSTTSASTSATFPAPGTYVLRLAAGDGALTAQDEVTFQVFPAGSGNGDVVISDRVKASVYFGRSSTNLQQAQSFRPAGPFLARVSVALAKRGTPAQAITVHLRTTLKGADLASAVIPRDTVTSTDGMKPDWVTVSFPDPVSMAPGTPYSLVLTVPGYSTSHHYYVATNTGNPYADGFFFRDTSGSVTYTTDMLARLSFGDGVNEPPGKAAITTGPATCDMDSICTYGAMATDPDGDILRATFDWGDGKTTDTDQVSSGTAATAGHAWRAAGTYSVRARAVDGDGLAGEWSDILMVTVSGAPNNPPLVPVVSSGTAEGTAGEKLTFTVSATDPDGDSVKLEWDWGDGSAGDSLLLASGTEVALTHTWQSPGTYPVTVRAVDEHGASSPWSGALEVRIDPPATVVVDLATSPTSSWNLGSAATRKKEVQSFTAEGTTLESVRLGFARVRNPSGLIRISIRAGLYGAPLAETNVGAGQIGSTDYRNPTWFTLTFPSPPQLTPGSTYYLVLEADRI
ncbi:MAG: PKD domain-containing protein, partial [Methanomicrobiales archaeon]|nr:PKD domain-containing protein [Methanomicrobiales archaeon]